jgi:hypothetical protein
VDWHGKPALQTLLRSEGVKVHVYYLNAPFLREASSTLNGGMLCVPSVRGRDAGGEAQLGLTLLVVGLSAV